MEEVRGQVTEDVIKLFLAGHIDSNNAAAVEAEISSLLGDAAARSMVIDAGDLVYISSAGLRMILRLRKRYEDLTITGVSSEIYEILEMTGFTQMMTVEKAYRVVSVDGCEVIGQGANGTVYRIDGDNVVKVYNNADALDEIQHEREVARLAMILGVPTAISYDVVRVGDSYGSVFELLDAKSFSKILATYPEKMDWCVDEYVEMLKIIHGTVVPEGKLPDMRETALDWARFMQNELPEEAGAKLLRLVEAVPQDNHMIHGDYHTKNLELVGDEVLLIDMDTLAVGHPIFELASMFNAYIGFSELDPEIIRQFQGFDHDTAAAFWHKTLEKYLGTQNEAVIRKVEDKARIIGYTRMIRRSIRRNGKESEQGRQEIAHWTGELLDLLARTDSLLFTRNEMEIEAVGENLAKVMSFVDEHLEEAGCPMRAQMQIDLAVEEIFVNIANYAYRPDKGNATIRVEVSENPLQVTLTFVDRGVPYDPLARQDPDVSLPAEQREIGGLGIFLVKQTMDDVTYEYKDGQNILTLKKSL
ncbi:MAG: ATP-binding protein [Clostridiales bacterium]|nr:ATP-binding protein [Clostridiales bacterium]